ncbi:DUF4192 domain-containing protein [Paractinoplanes rishiriensis]|nr:DUF4192 domain-containing protein [Actinoplanes rishiriensis]
MTPDCSITARSSAAIVAATPYVIGFHPTDSVVVIGLANGMITFGMRCDLPSPADDDDAGIAGIVLRQRLTHAVVLGYGRSEELPLAVARMCAALDRAGVLVADAVRVAEGRWWSYCCTDRACCPPEGRPIDPGLAAPAVYQGRVALPDRKALVARVAPVRGAARKQMTAATERARDRLTDLRANDLDAVRSGGWVRRAGRRAIREAEVTGRAGAVPTADEVAWLGVVLMEKGVLGYALDRTEHGKQDWRIALWADAVRRVDRAYAAGPACLLAFAAWRSGDGALARVAIDRALRDDPEHHTAVLLDDLLRAGVPPDALVRLAPPA